jgi:hypothetical protein
MELWVWKGQTINLSVVNATEYSGLSYQWTSSADNTFSSSQASISPTINSSTVFTVKYGTCQTSVSVTMNACDFVPTASNIVVKGDVLTGTTINLSTNTTLNTATYAWAGPKQFSSLAQNPSISQATSASVGIYTVTVVRNSYCSASATTSVMMASRKKRDRGDACGLNSNYTPENTTPLTNLAVGDTLWAADFEVVINLIDPASQSSAGIYKGYGVLRLPYLKGTPFLVKLNNVAINEDYELIGGNVETLYESDNWQTGITDVKKIAQDIVALIKSLSEAIAKLLVSDVSNPQKLIDALVTALKEQASKELPAELADKYLVIGNKLSQAKAAYDAASSDADKTAATAAYDAAKAELSQLDTQKNAFLNQYANIVKMALADIFNENQNAQLPTYSGVSVDLGDVVMDDDEIPISNTSSIADTEKVQVNQQIASDFSKTKASFAKSVANTYKDGDATVIGALSTKLRYQGLTLQEYLYGQLKQNASFDTLKGVAKTVILDRIEKWVIEKVYNY